MTKTFTIARVSGIPLKIHLNWLITVALVIWSLSVGYFPLLYGGWTPATYWTVGAVTTLLFFVSVLFHEFGHALAAQDEDVQVNSITLFIFGGVAHIAHEPPTARSEFRIVVAGPFSSLVLAGAFQFLAGITALGPAFQAASLYLSHLNLILAAFNLIPGFPLDGGRILRAILWKINGSFRWATRWATYIGIGIALLFVVSGIWLMVQRNYIAGIWMAFIGFYLGNAARESYQQSIQDYESTTSAAQQEQLQPESQLAAFNESPVFPREWAYARVYDGMKEQRMVWNENPWVEKSKD